MRALSLSSRNFFIRGKSKIFVVTIVVLLFDASVRCPKEETSVINRRKVKNDGGYSPPSSPPSPLDWRGAGCWTGEGASPLELEELLLLTLAVSPPG